MAKGPPPIDPLWAEIKVEIPEGITDPDLHFRCSVCKYPMWGIINPTKAGLSKENQSTPPRDICDDCKNTI